MIQVQTRIFVDHKEHSPIRLEIDILEREDSNANERKIAEAVEAVILKMQRHVVEKAGLTIETKRITKDSPVWVDVVDKTKEGNE